MRVTFQNPSGQARRGWVPFTIPGAKAVRQGQMGHILSGPGKAPVLAIAGEKLEGVQIVHADIYMPPFGSWFGELVWVPETWTIEKATGWAVPFKAEIEVVPAEGDTATFAFPGPTDWKRQRDGAVWADVFSWPRLPGCPIVGTLWQHHAEGADKVEFELTLRCSDPSSVKVREQFKSIRLLSDVPFVTRWAGRVSRPPVVPEGGRWAQTLLQNDFIGDSQALVVAGVFLFPPTEKADPSNASAWAEQGLRLQSLAAEVDGPVRGYCSAWAEHLGFSLPYWVDQQLLWNDARKRVNRWAHDVGDTWDVPRFGLEKEPGRTGDQQGFGLFKCMDVMTLGQPLLLDEIHWSALQGLACRPGHYCEPTGSKVYGAIHINPRWITWSEITHRDPAVSHERFGKVDGVPQLDDLHGWYGRDAEHHSPILEVAAYMLTGSLQIADLLEDVRERLVTELTLPSMLGPGVVTHTVGAARAIGRTMQAAFHLDWVLPTQAKITPHMRKRFAECIWPQWSGRVSSLDELFSQSRDRVRVLDVQTYDHQPRGRGWRPPFECMGAYGLWLLYLSSNDPRVLGVIYQVMKSVDTYGYRNGRMLWGVHAPDAADPTAPLSLEDYATGGDMFQEGGGDWDWWGFAGLKVGVMAAKAIGDGALVVSLSNRMDRIRAEARDRFDAQGNALNADLFWRYLEWTIGV